MSGERRLSVKNLTFGYGDRMLFQDLSLEMDSGFLSIIGPNGSGKTTLIRLMAGLLTPNGGSVRIFGRELGKMTPNQRAKAYTVINQRQTFHFPFTCMELVSLSRYPHKKDLNNLSPEDYRVIVEAMRDTDVLQFKDSMITDLSGGEQQRVVLAAALAQDTPILYLDEAFSALDISRKANMIRLLKERIREKKLLVAAIMHDLNDAYRYSDKVCLMEKGEIAGFDAPEAVMTGEAISRVFQIRVEQIEGKGFFINL